MLTIYSQTHSTGVDETVNGALINVRGLNEGYGSFAWRCLNASVALGLYIWHAIWPEGVHVLYLPQVGKVPDQAVLGLCVLGAVAGAFIFAWWRFRGARGVLAGGALWALAAVGPTLGVAGGFGFHALADRFTYVPAMAIGFLVLVASGGRMRGRWRRLVVCGIALPMAGGIAAWGAWHARTYRSNITLFEQAARCDAKHFVAHGELGAEYCKMGRVAEGIALLRGCLAAYPVKDVAVHLANTLATRGWQEDFAEIKRLCAGVTEKDSSIVQCKALDAMGTVAMFEHRWGDAIVQFTRALQLPTARILGDDTPMRLAMCHFNVKDWKKAQPILVRLAGSKRPEVRAKAREMLQLIWQAEKPSVML